MLAAEMGLGHDARTMLTITNPANATTFQTVDADDAASVQQKAASARAAQRDWATTSLPQRMQAITRFEAQLRLLGPLVDMAVFAPLFGAAVYFRRRPGLHKRLMIVATTSLLIAAVGRMAFLGTPASAWLVSLVWVSPILLAMAYDWFEHRTVHPVYAAGAAILVAERIWRSGARESETWAAVCAWLATLVG
jgi:hypothetical protein